MISCPACAGVVRAQVEPPFHLDFVCSVGHVFSLEELFVAKEDQLEHAQWSLIALLKHLHMILQIDAESEAKHLSRHIALVERMIQETRLPSIHEGHTEMNVDDLTAQEGI
ncbi:MAG TPA: hypothetical protein VFU48_03440 [Nitrospira sp.]|jgi:hypothetical protein|nr:hypothetical protein [Nitrospira sp.]